MSEDKKKLIIVGTGPQAQIAGDYFAELSNYEVCGFACHSEFKESDEIYGMPLIAIEDLPDKHSPDDTEAFVAIGYLLQKLPCHQENVCQASPRWQ